MDGHPFDQFVLTFSSSSSRFSRRAIAGLASGLLAVLPAAFGDEVGAKRKRKKRKKKKRPSDCVPQCAASNACGPDGCGGSCGVCAAPSCQGTTLTTHVCGAGVCTLATTDCAAGQVCFQNACCTKTTRPDCHKVPVNDGCGGVYPPNCTQNCCEGPSGGLICQAQPCQ